MYLKKSILHYINNSFLRFLNSGGCKGVRVICFKQKMKIIIIARSSSKKRVAP